MPFDNHRERLIQGLEAAHSAYYEIGTFGGPSLHFHLQALAASEAGDFDCFAQSVYAVLGTWGMHRMGPRGPKMREFTEFQASLQPLWPMLLSLQQASPDNLDRASWEDLARIFHSIRCMKSGISLVGNSKVMAHALPKLVAPIDREYTLTFLFGNRNIPKGIAAEWKRFESIHREFFHPVVASDVFMVNAQEWLQQRDSFQWDTSPLKIADNLVIGLVSSERLQGGDSQRGASASRRRP